MTWLRRRYPVPVHSCSMPSQDRAEDHDVWMCDTCFRAYIWSDSAGYGFEWRRVFFRYWYYRMTGGIRED